MPMAAAQELTALFVSVVPTFAGAVEAVKGGAKVAATEFAAGFKTGLTGDMPKAVEPVVKQASDAFKSGGKQASDGFSKALGDALPEQVKKVSDDAAQKFDVHLR